MRREPATLPDSVFDSDIPDGLVAQQLARADLQETLWRLAWRLCYDEGPRVHDKLLMLHAVTDPACWRSTIEALTALDQFTKQNPTVDTTMQYIESARRAVLTYAAAIAPKERAKPKGKEKVAVDIQNVDRKLDF